MAVTQDGLMALAVPGKEFSYTDNDTMLYALSIGMGADPMNRQELAFCYEKDLKVMPSMATVVAFDDSLFWNCGLDVTKIVHGEQRMTMHAPLPAAGTVVSDVRVTDAFDKGEGRGALVVVETVLTDKATGTKLCTMESVVFARGDGGYGGPAGSPAALPQAPLRPANAVAEFQTLPQQALFYRLCGDRNPLHADPDFAAAGGFDRPILHGLCTWGHACHAVVRTMCGYDPSRLKSFAARFSAPVFPGEKLQVHVWREDEGIHFTVTVPARDIMVLTNGFAELAG